MREKGKKSLHILSPGYEEYENAISATQVFSCVIGQLQQQQVTLFVLLCI